MSRLINLIGQKFERLLVLSKEPTIPGKHTFWKCQCDCGNIVSVDGTKLRRKSIKSCGCYKAEQTRKRMTKHGLSNSPEHVAWTNMLQRCTNPNNWDFHHYGGRGVSVCESWLGDDGFINFYNDMGPKPFPKATLDRINTNGHYEKNNCQWVSQTSQVRNQTNNKIKDMNEANHIRELYSNGSKISDLARHYNCSKTCIERIINNTSWYNE